MNKIKLKNQKYEFKIIRSNRKTIGIIVNADQELLVRSPKRTSIRKIKSLLTKKEDWILKKLAKMAEIKDPPKAKEFINGETLLYLGREYKLKLIAGSDLNELKVNLEQDRIKVYFPAELENDNEKRKAAVRDQLISWFRSQANLKINELINDYKKHLDVEPNNVVIKKQRKRWGSCSSKQNLNFNWKIIMAPLEIIEYLVVHELVHLIHPNHSKDYWQTVAEIIPDYNEKKEWLRINGRRLTI
jgi:predicted metal-dependent hydrolase